MVFLVGEGLLLTLWNIRISGVVLWFGVHSRPSVVGRVALEAPSVCHNFIQVLNPLSAVADFCKEKPMNRHGGISSLHVSHSAYIFMHVISQVINIWLWALSQPPQGIVQWQPWVSQIQNEQKAFATCLFPSASCKGRLWLDTILLRLLRQGTRAGYLPKGIYLLPDCTGSHLSGGMSRTLPWLFLCFLAAGDSHRCNLPVNRLSSWASLLWVSVSPFRKDKATSVASENKLFFRTGWLFSTLIKGVFLPG